MERLLINPLHKLPNLFDERDMRQGKEIYNKLRPILLSKNKINITLSYELTIVNKIILNNKGIIVYDNDKLNYTLEWRNKHINEVTNE